MTESVIVIHGVGNRDEAVFNDRVKALQAATNNVWDMVPVYWGDLAAHEELVAEAVPQIDGIRDGDIAGDPNDVAGLLFGVAPAGGGDTRGAVRNAADSVDLVLQGAAVSTGSEVRVGSERAPEVLEVAVRDEWPKLDWLPSVTDPEALTRIGQLIAAPTTATVDRGGVETRDQGLAEVRLSFPDLGGFAKRRLHELDELMGCLIRDSAGRLNQYMRTKLGPSMTKFFGDVLVYQRHREEIQARVRERVASHDPQLGTSEDHPALVAGHSLGGVIAFDIAVLPTSPLWTKSLVTFGSQAPFFHVCDPREGLAPFTLQQQVKLPRSLARWTNLWEPLDVVAFVAARVFVLNDGSNPTDIEIPHLASSGAWTHSVYWETPELVKALSEAFA